MMNKTLNWLFDYPNLKVFQYEEGFKFSLDSILLFEFAQIKKDDYQIIDFCTGNAVIPILIQNKYNKSVIGVEYQEKIYQLAKESVQYNHMEKEITLIQDNVKDLKNYFPGNNFDVILCNPPYFKYVESSNINKNLIKSIARHEICITLKDIFEVASFFLKDKGRFYLVHIPDRIDEIFVYANHCGLAVKELQFVYSKADEKPVMVLVTCVKGGRFGTRVYPPVNIGGLPSYQGIFRK